ncbi:hypothetical protein HUJ05_010991 [Dendroctonus ponderosae]|nr:hypothetical protein HUJ05_010991 [Dendroctonus ponderosae]
MLRNFGSSCLPDGDLFAFRPPHSLAVAKSRKTGRPGNSAQYANSKAVACAANGKSFETTPSSGAWLGAFESTRVQVSAHWLESRQLPPGPWGVPVFGSLLRIKGDLHLFYRDLTHKYGSLISARLGSQLIIVLSDYKTIRDAFRKEEFTGRPSTELTNILDGYGECLRPGGAPGALTQLGGLGAGR